MRTITKAGIATAAAAVALATTAVSAAATGGSGTAPESQPAGGPAVEAVPASWYRNGLQATGLTKDGQLVVFRTDRPGDARSVGKVTGLDGDGYLVGIDYRVQDGKLYGVGDKGGIYTINTKTAKATKVSQLSVALSGTTFGVDFNPAANRLRVISDTGQNLRHNIDDPMGAPAAGVTAVDGTLTYPAAGTTPAATGMGVTAAAYTNNDLDARTATTLFDIDTMRDQVVVQSPANAGLLAPTGMLTVDAATDAGFDIYSTVKDGRSVDSTAFAALSVGGTYRLFSVNLLTGAADDRGSFPTAAQITDIALPLNQR